ncbi:hypothetical protein Y032_0025g1285 [Ancylostoma ceylanicum]|uniref:Uncharacterized protein n=1 Tax=Ancylostoma ceylanicum TaxID=53326 RepID=A0A016UV13_9BILA|nr:hypothetical protein Y032_0025g1285 [Ancylostoma ceylanicum]
MSFDLSKSNLDGLMEIGGISATSRSSSAGGIPKVTQSWCGAAPVRKLLFFENQHYGILFIFQQNNAAIYDGRSKTAWFVDCFGFSYLPGLLL